MYIPEHFIVSEVGILHDFIRRYSFGLLVTSIEGEPFATHLPLLLDPRQGTHGTLLGHVAKTNPHGRFFTDTTSLAVFSGPHAYISPTWYETPNTVPTWNYTVVHVYGKIERVEDPSELARILTATADVYERQMPNPWTFDSSTTFAERMMSQIVGFRMLIDRIEGKFKLNQNHPQERRDKVIRALTTQGDENSLGIADLMQKSPPPLRGEP